MVLKDVRVEEGPMPCRLGGLPVRASRQAFSAERAPKPGDLVRVRGVYDEEACTVQLEEPTHAVEVVAAAPVPIELEGVVERVARGSLVLRNVTVLKGPTPCTLSALPLEIQQPVLAPKEVAEGDKLAVVGEYSEQDCKVVVKAPPHLVELLPVPIELEGVVKQGSPRRFTLRDVEVLDGPDPCTLDGLPVRVASSAPAPAPEVWEKVRVRVVGEYRPDACEVQVAGRGHRVEVQPTVVRWEGQIAQALANPGRLTLEGVEALDGPEPCRRDRAEIMTPRLRPAPTPRR